MRILWINHRDPMHPQAGGAEVHIREVGKRLVERGHEVTLLVERFDNSRIKDTVDGINIERRGGKFTLHLFAPYFVKRNSDKFDVIIDDIAHAVPFWSQRFTKRPVVAIVHHVHQNVVGIELAPLLRQLVKEAEQSIRNTYRNIIAVSKTTEESLIKELKVEESRIRVIRNGIDHAKYRPGQKFDKPTLLWMGRMKKYKNVEHVLRAFRSIRESVNDAKLILAGSGEEYLRMKILAREMGLNDSVSFRGWVSEEEKIRLLQGAWCVVYASIVEGWGLVIMEAAACKTPAVGYDSGALREAIVNGETGFLVRFGDVEELASRITEILRNDSLRARLCENALRYSFDFDWNKTTEQTEEYLKAIC